MAKSRGTAKIWRRVTVAAWAGQPLAGLSDAATLAWLYLATGPESLPIPGIAIIGPASLGEIRGWPAATTKRALAELEARGAVRADWPRRLAWLPHAHEMAAPENPAQVAGWRAYWPMVPACPLRAAIASEIRAGLATKGDAWAVAWDDVARGDVGGDVPPEVPLDVPGDVGGDVTGDRSGSGSGKGRGNTPHSPPGGEDVAFDAFWLGLPDIGRSRSGKDKARKAWMKQGCAAVADDVMRGLAAWNLSDTRFFPGAHVWISDRRWENPPPPAMRSVGRPPPDDFTGLATGQMDGAQLDALIAGKAAS